MIIKENINIYLCSFCKKKYFRKGDCARHEKMCTHNPENKAECVGCEHIMTVTRHIEVDRYDMPIKKPYTSFYCNKLKQSMYPHKVVRIGLLDRYPETFENDVQMPKECKHFKPDFF